MIVSTLAAALIDEIATGVVPVVTENCALSGSEVVRSGLVKVSAIVFPDAGIAAELNFGTFDVVFVTATFVKD